MTILAVFFMSTALLLVTALTTWCYFLVLRKPDRASSTDSLDSGPAD